MIAVDLGKISYDESLYYQESVHAMRVEGRIDDVVFLVEHDSIITIGKSGGERDLLVPEEVLIKRGIPVRRVNRGGKITCHYPGQLVVYPIMDLNDHHMGVFELVNNLEEIIIRALADFGIKGERVRRNRGVFVKDNKISSIGLEVRKSVTMHGLSLNVFEDWSLYSLFIPCGITDKGITFLRNCLPPDSTVDMKMIKKNIVHHFERIFSVSIAEIVLPSDCSSPRNLDFLISAGHFDEPRSIPRCR
jgi:lipoate-protein ligase B